MVRAKNKDDNQRNRLMNRTESYVRLNEPIMWEDADFPKYCPNCGAKIDGERKDNEID